ncbi:MAG: RNA-binding transcriptional accessory protein [Erysipelotrichales bacterium]|nr:RNA-binding transcriptional accessory protein [Erysipelotrichales bacterium]
MEELISQIATELKITTGQVKSTLNLLEEGNTVPFIARYRKEVTKGLDEDAIRHIEEEYKYQVNLKKRKEDVLRIIAEQGKLTEEIQKEVESCTKLSQVEDIYRPYQQKKKTRATMAIALGLEPLADFIMGNDVTPIVEYAATFVNDKVKNVEDALQGAMDILAERFSDDAKIREVARNIFRKTGVLVTKTKKDFVDEKQVYQMYYDYSEKVSTLANHRIMAIDRAEKEKVINASITFDDEKLYEMMCERFLKNVKNDCHQYVDMAIKDGAKRLLIPSVEREIRSNLTERAQLKSVDLFAMNVEKLLLQSPMKNKWVLGFDPAYKHGCKLAVVDPTGKMLEIAVIYPHAPQNQVAEAKKVTLDLLNRYPIDIVAIGNGTASRESQNFIASLLHEVNHPVTFTMVSEAGASVYSASPLAKAEFPDLTVEKRSAISIARRIIDPLAELIKIDPKSIGVGQYQHDLPAKELNEKLDFVVLKAVNRVGVDVNTASAELLAHVAGLSNAIAKAIVTYRDKNGKFKNRQQLLDVPKMGPKSFEQAAGFLRIVDGDNALDKSSIHPESYGVAEALMKKQDINPTMLGSDEVKAKLVGLNISELARELNIDEYTMFDIVDSLKAPLRDYREQYEAPLLRSDILEIKDLKVGDELEGVVRNVVDFGAFVDIGLHDDGLIHVSKISKSRISHPSEILSIGDIIKVKVFNIDLNRNKVQLTLI